LKGIPLYSPRLKPYLFKEIKI